MTAEKQIKTIKEYIEFKNKLEKLARNSEIGLVMLTDVIDYKTNKLKAIIVQYPPTHSILITCKEILEMIQNRELEHLHKTIIRCVFENVREVFEMIVKKLAMRYEIYKSEVGAVIYKIDKYRDVEVGRIDVYQEGIEKNIDKKYKLKIHRVKCRNFIIKIISSDEDDIRNLTNVENLMNEYINFGRFKSLESDYCRMV